MAVKKEAGRVSKFQYDDRMRLTQVKIVQGEESLTTTMVYNEAGRMTSIADGSTTVRFSYDRFGSKLLKEGPVGTFKYMYNEHGLLSMRQCEFKGSKDKFITSYTYDNYNRVTKVESPAGTYQYSWNKSNKIKAIEFGNGQKIVYKYDKVNRLIRKKMGNTVLVSYKYDVQDRRVAASYMGVKWKYAYDQYNQLLKAESSLKQKYNYNYDTIGNRISAYSDLIASAKTFDYNSLNQISSKGYSYDQWGNMVQASDTKYKYDLRNRLVEVIKDGMTIKYIYDALDQRIAVVENGKQTDYLMSGMVEYARKTDTNTQYHTLGLDIAGSLYKTGAVSAVLASSDASGKGFDYLYDGNGNVVASCDDNGNIISKLSYSPFGKQLDGKILPFTFSTKTVDGSGMSYYGYRFYDNESGRWTNRDPVQEQGGINIYGFVTNNALSIFDVLGLDIVCTTPANACSVSAGDEICGSWVEWNVEITSTSEYNTYGDWDVTTPTSCHFEGSSVLGGAYAEWARMRTVYTRKITNYLHQYVKACTKTYTYSMPVGTQYCTAVYSKDLDLTPTTDVIIDTDTEGSSQIVGPSLVTPLIPPYMACASLIAQGSPWE